MARQFAWMKKAITQATDRPEKIQDDHAVMANLNSYNPLDYAVNDSHASAFLPAQISQVPSEEIAEASSSDPITYSTNLFNQTRNVITENPYATLSIFVFTAEKIQFNSDTLATTSTLNKTITEKNSTNDSSEVSLQATFLGSHRNDYIVVWGSGDEIHGGYGNDYIIGIGCYNALYGDAGNDRVIGSSCGYDLLSGGDGNDVVVGKGAGNALYGDGGHDRLTGGYGGNNYLFGGWGNDTIVANCCYNTVYGNEGADRIYTGTLGRDTIYAGSGNDVIYIRGSGNAIFGDEGADKIYSNVNGNNVIYGGDGNDFIRAYVGDRVEGQNGNDTIYSLQGYANISGGAGNDVIVVYGARNVVSGDAGNDRILVVNGHGNELNGGAGSDYIRGGIGNDTFVYDFNQNQGTFDYYLGAKGFDTLVIKLSMQQYQQYETAFQDFQNFLIARPGGLFNFSHYDPADQFMQLLVQGIESVQFQLDNIPPWDIELAFANMITDQSIDGALLGTISSQNDPSEIPTYAFSLNGTLSQHAGPFSINAQTGAITVDTQNGANPLQIGNYQVTVNVNDGTGLSTEKLFTLSVIDSTLPPLPPAPTPSTGKYDGMLNGAGQTVVVIDTGVDYNVAALSGGIGGDYRMVAGVDFVNGGVAYRYTSQEHYHGTHVASIIAADGVAQKGWAPKSDLVTLKVLDNNGSGSFSMIHSALVWVANNYNKFENPITTVNLSLGDGGFYTVPPAWTSTMQADFARLESLGIFISVAAGNSFNNAQPTIGVSYPGVDPSVVPVASHNASGVLSSFSQRADDVIVARGGAVSAYVSNDFNYSHQVVSDGKLATLSGTSMAAPQVAGASMQIRELMEITGYQHQGLSKEDAITQIMRGEAPNQTFDLADKIYDPYTHAYYDELNMKSAASYLMNLVADDNSTIDLGSALTQGVSGFITGTMTFDSAANNYKILGFSGYEKDFFSFDATSSGKLYLNAVSTGASTWAPQWEISSAVVNGSLASLDVIAGQHYTFNLTSTHGIGSYTIVAAMNNPEVLNLARSSSGSHATLNVNDLLTSGGIDLGTSSNSASETPMLDINQILNASAPVESNAAPDFTIALIPQENALDTLLMPEQS